MVQFVVNRRARSRRAVCGDTSVPSLASLISSYFVLLRVARVLQYTSSLSESPLSRLSCLSCVCLPERVYVLFLAHASLGGAVCAEELSRECVYARLPPACPRPCHASTDGQ